MTPNQSDTYREIRQALADEQADQHNSPERWPQWIQVVLAVGVIVVSVVLAYGALDKRISLIEQALHEQRDKLDLIIYQQSGKR